MIYAFWSADSKCGATMISQTAAEIAAQSNSKSRIILLHLDGKPGFDYTNKNGNSIDSIKAAISAKVITMDDMEAACSVENNLYQLKGTSNLIERKSISQTEIVDKLLEFGNEYFDTIIIDAGSNIDMPMALQSLLRADKRILVTTQQPSALENYICGEEQVFRPTGINFGEMLVNKFAIAASNFLPGELLLARKYGISEKKVYTLPAVSFGWQAEAEKTTVYSYNNKAYNTAFNNYMNTSFNIKVIKQTFSFIKRKGE